MEYIMVVDKPWTVKLHVPCKGLCFFIYNSCKNAEIGDGLLFGGVKDMQFEIFLECGDGPLFHGGLLIG